MRKLLCLILTALLLCFAGCGQTSGSPGAAPADPVEKAGSPASEPEADTPDVPETPVSNGRTVVLDPGHQAGGDAGQEPIGPGASQMKAKVATGTQSSFTGLAEYQLTLDIALQLEQVLLERGYTVYLTRRDNETTISNAERAQYASQVGGEILVRLHANGSTDPAANGAMTICQTPENPYQSCYDASHLLSQHLLDAYCAATGFASQGIWETDTMTGINWCSIPSTIVEMGYMTNESDDAQMADPAFQETMVQALADGIDAYFAEADKTFA
ncbi:MAG: N-acetylmuramoyl-L-alanine amidase [Oscillospiraceae bacterium]|nr:N-acetylmuramoyl-L-alanine amidase [Oscillospiraceae bacterium]